MYGERSFYTKIGPIMTACIHVCWEIGLMYLIMYVLILMQIKYLSCKKLPDQYLI